MKHPCRTILFLISITVLVSSCKVVGTGKNGTDSTNGGTGTSPDGSGGDDITAPTVKSVFPADNGSMTVSGAITIRFSESLDTSGLGGSGAMYMESDIAVYSQTVVKNDTVTIKPAVYWSIGDARELSISAYDVAGNEVKVNLKYNVTPARLYVSTSGNDSFPGTQAQPKRTLQHAIDYAASHFTDTNPQVILAQGTYSVSDTVSTVARVSILGGFNPSNWNERNPSTFVSNVVDSRNSGGSLGSPNAAILISGSMEDAVFDGITFTGGTGAHSAAVLINNGSRFQLQNCTINGGAASGNSYGVMRVGDTTQTGYVWFNTISGGSGSSGSYGVYMSNSAGAIRTNTINGGSSSSNYGVFVTGSGNASFTDNTINGGSGTNSYGVAATASAATFTSNTITGGTGSTTARAIYTYSATSPYPTFKKNTINGGTSVTTYAVVNNSAIPYIYQNKIHGGTATTTSYGIYNSSAEAEFYNNMIYGGTSGGNAYGIYLDGVGGAMVHNNTITGGTGGTGAGNQSVAVFVNNTPNATPIEDATDVTDIANNILFTTSANTKTCIRVGAVGKTFQVRNNDLFNCTRLMYSDVDACTGNNDADSNPKTCNLADINALAGGGSNLASDPQLTNLNGPDNDVASLGDNDWRLTSSSPSGVRNNGIDGYATGFSFYDDFNEAERSGNGTTGWSMGAFEL